MVLVSWQNSALQMARYRRGAPQTPAGSRITRMRLIGLRRGASHDLSSIGNHLKEIGVIAVTDGHWERSASPKPKKCSHSTRVLKKLYPSRASTVDRMGQRH